MSELVLKVKPGSGYDDGDILCAFNHHRIRREHVQHLCIGKGPMRWVDKGLNANAVLPPADISKDFMDNIAQYRYERTGANTLTIRRLSDDSTIDIQSGVPYIGFRGRPEAMDIPLRVSRIKASLVSRETTGIPIFGNQNREFWYGGRTDFGNDRLTVIWASIVDKLGRHENDGLPCLCGGGLPLWPAQHRDLKSYLFLPTTDFDDAEAEALVEQGIDDTDPENPVAIKKRKRQLVWRDLNIGRTVRDIEDRSKSIDVRQSIAPVDRKDVAIKQRILRQ